MNEPTYDSVFKFIAQKYEAKLAERGIAADALTETFDLFAEGIIDSLGMLELVGSIETEFEIEVDLSAMDPEQMTVVGHLSRFIATNAGKTSNTASF